MEIHVHHKTAEGVSGLQEAQTSLRPKLSRLIKEFGVHTMAEEGNKVFQDSAGAELSSRPRLGTRGAQCFVGSRMQILERFTSAAQPWKRIFTLVFA